MDREGRFHMFEIEMDNQYSIFQCWDFIIHSPFGEMYFKFSLSAKDFILKITQWFIDQYLTIMAKTKAVATTGKSLEKKNII
jgi:hypothetical protein